MMLLSIKRFQENIPASEDSPLRALGEDVPTEVHIKELEPFHVFKVLIQLISGICLGYVMKPWNLTEHSIVAEIVIYNHLFILHTFIPRRKMTGEATEPTLLCWTVIFDVRKDHEVPFLWWALTGLKQLSYYLIWNERRPSCSTRAVISTDMMSSP